MDLDDEILALAGDEPSTNRQSKRKRATSSRRKPSDFSESDDDYDFSEDEEVSSGSEEDENLKIINEWGDDLMGDEEDRRRLNAMNDLEREKVLAERAEQRQLVLDRLELKKKVKGNDSKRAEPLDRRTSSRRSTKKTRQSLKDLKRQRDEKTSKKAEDDGRRSRSGYYSSQSENEEEGELDTSKLDWTSDSKEQITLDQMQSITLSRADFEKWVYARFFKDTVLGCFVRVGLGLDHEKKPKYRVAQINDVVDYHRIYNLGQTSTRKALSLSHGKAKKVFLMDVISNQPIQEAEYKRYLAAVEADKEQLPSLSFVSSKADYVKEKREHEEIEEMVHEKKTIMNSTSNVGSEKIRLKRLLEEAEETGEEETAQQIRAQLAKYEEISLEKRKQEIEKFESLTKQQGQNVTVRARQYASNGNAAPKKPVFRRLPSELASFVRVEEVVFGDDPYIKELTIEKLKSLLKAK
ncbi:RNA polymerase-associated protein rtf1 [Phlyctochytrium planicorne]|nr:RNA polymerase-associated protein rtf1 [Phlyctochytrium planicorne]